MLEPRGAFPQPALRLDADPRISAHELRVRVQRINVDSASFRQLREECGDDADRVGGRIAAIVRERGKLHNPVTGSGGMLVGVVEEVGAGFRGLRAVSPGARVASLISLTLTPLRLERVHAVDLATAQLEADGTAILFESSPFALLPDDVPTGLALAALDVAGAPARTAAMVRPGDRVTILGAGGTSGLLSLHEARRRAGAGGVVTAVEWSQAALDDVGSTGLADHLVRADARDALACSEAVLALAAEADLTVNCVNVAGSELASILLTRPSGTVLFFSMATSFTAAALGAEGLGRPTELVIGNGHMPDMGETALAVLRASPAISGILARRHAEHALPG